MPTATPFALNFQGIHVPVITPFRDDGGIDAPAWEAMIEHLIGAGVHGVIVGGTTGEYYALTAEERLGQFTRAREIVAGRVPLLCGVNALRTEESCGFARAARAAGADGLLVASPPYSLPTESELAAHCLAIDQAAGLPIMLYNYPARTGADMGPAFLARVGAERNFCAIKESSGDIARLHLIAREFPQLQLSCGADDQALEYFAWGARSWVCAAGNCIPKETIALYEACVVAGDFATGRRIMAALLPFMIMLERGGKFIQCVKHACALQGLPAGAVRKPMRPLGDALKGELRDVLAAAQGAIAEIIAGGSKGGGSKEVGEGGDARLGDE